MFKELFEANEDENFDTMITQLKKYFGVKKTKILYHKMNGKTLLVSIKDYDSGNFEKFKKYWEPDYHIGLSSSGGKTVSAYLK
jgi:hypothetical protein